MTVTAIVSSRLLARLAAGSPLHPPESGVCGSNCYDNQSYKHQAHDHHHYSHHRHHQRLWGGHISPSKVQTSRQSNLRPREPRQNPWQRLTWLIVRYITLASVVIAVFNDLRPATGLQLGLRRWYAVCAGNIATILMMVTLSSRAYPGNVEEDLSMPGMIRRVSVSPSLSLHVHLIL